MKRLYTVNNTLRKRNPESTDIQVCTFVGLALSEDEASGEATRKAFHQFPAADGWFMHGPPFVTQVPDELVVAASLELSAAKP